MKFAVGPVVGLFFISLALFPLGAQDSSPPPSLKQRVFTQYNEKTGLPSNTVLGVHQDQMGYIWLASYEGLIRFDGQRVTVINKETSNSFLANSARTLLEGTDGVLYIGTNTDGLAILKNGQFTLLGADQGLQNLSVRSLALDSKGKLWIGTANGIAIIEKGTIQTYQDKVPQALGIVNLILPLAEGQVLSASNSPGIWELAPDGAHPFILGSGFDDRIFFAMAQDSQGVLWLGTSLGEILQVKDGKIQSVYQHPSFRGYAINDFFVDSQDTLWISTDRGILTHHLGVFTPFEPEIDLLKDVIYSIREDKENNLWIASKSGGLFKISNSKFANLSQTEGLIQNSVNALAEDSAGGLWVGTDGGVSYWRDGKFQTNPAVLALKDRRVRHVLVDGRGRPWFSTYSNLGLAYFESGSLKTISVDQGLPVNRVRLTYEDRQGRFWVGTTSGLCQIENGQVTRTLGQKEGLPNQFIMALQEDSKGNLWIGTDGGGVALLTLQDKVEIFNKDSGLAGNVVFRFLKDRQNRMWIATSDGISLWDGEAFHNLNARRGLLSDTIFQILEDPNENLWFSTNRGIQIVPTNAVVKAVMGKSTLERGRIWDQRDGLAGQITSTSWATTGKSGQMYWPTLLGVSVLNLSRLPINHHPPPVLIELVDIDGIKHLGHEDLVISPGQSRITIDFTALSFQVPEKVKFQYFLQGYDKDWTPLVRDRTATYTNLSGGTYEFRVRALNNDGIPSTSEAVQRLVKQPYYWENPFFYVIMGLILVSAGFGINGLRIRGLKARKEELEVQVQQRTKDLESEKAKTEALLLNIFPPLVAQQLKEKGSATPETFGDVTVMFVDLVDFTPKTELMEPSEVIQELNQIFAGFDALITGHRCERIKTIGDAYLAVCGMPQSDPLHAKRIALAALDMRKYIETRNQKHKNKWEIRLGIHSGKVVGGVVGIKRYVYDIFGDTINTASRMETNSKPMKITVSQTTAQLLAEDFVLIPRPEKKIKGKGSMKMFFLER